MSEAPRDDLSRWALWFAGLAFFACYFGQTALGVVQPTIAADLDLTAGEAQWVVNGFFLTLALFAAPGGRLGDYYGHRAVLLAAFAIFGLGALLATAAQGFAWLVAGIAISGIGASTLYPASAALVGNRVSRERRGRAIGAYSAIGVSVLTLGPVLAGLLTEAIEWRAAFGAQAALAAALALVGWRRVDNRPVGDPQPFDFRGMSILAIGLIALLVALMQALAWGWDSPATIALGVAGLAGLGWFAAFELRSVHPLLDVGLLRGREMRGITLAMFASQFVITSLIIYLATYFQHVLGYGPLLASLALAPAVVTQPLFNVLSGRATDRIGHRRPALVGYLLTAAGLAWVAVFLDRGSYPLLLPGLLALGPGIAPTFTALLTGLSNAVGPAERGEANALVLTVRWIAAAAGTMILGVVIHAGEQNVLVPDAGPYADALAILGAVALLGALACAFVLPRSSRRGPRRHPHL